MNRDIIGERNYLGNQICMFGANVGVPFFERAFFGRFTGLFFPAITHTHTHVSHERFGPALLDFAGNGSLLAFFFLWNTGKPVT